MIPESAPVSVLENDGSLHDCQMRFWSADEQCALRLDCGDSIGQVHYGDDYFTCLTALRRSIENESRQLLCNGCRINAVVSRMSRSMSRGRKAYLVTLGREAELEDLVDIFDPAPPDTVGKVNEQAAFFFKVGLEP